MPIEDSPIENRPIGVPARWSRRLGGAGDLHWFVVGLLTAGAALAAFGLLFGPYPHERGPRAAFALGACVLIVIVRRWPVPLLGVAVGATAFLMASGVNSLPCAAVVGVATFVVASRLRRSSSLRWVAVAALVLAVAIIYAGISRHSHVVTVDSVEGYFPLVAGWFVGDSVATGRRYETGLAQQEARERLLEAEQARQQVRSERVRIARELHDVVAHTLAVITVQAGVGRRLMDRRPQEAEDALRSIEEIGRTAQDELRVVLGLLRDEGIETGSLAPAPRMVDLKELVEKVDASGTPVVLHMTGIDGVLSPVLELTIYRVVQEALTNVVKHAPGAPSTVGVTATGDEIRVDVVNQRPPTWLPDGDRDGEPVVPTPGHGIVGMRERVGAFGGWLDARVNPGGGFAVHARIPADGTS